jgi:cyanuric acid amidohydrolase
MTEVHWFDMAHPADYSRLLVLCGDMGGVSRLALLVKTEGHTATNDFARQLSRAVLDPLIASLADSCRVVAILANGCEGVATPGGYAFITRARVSAADSKGYLQFGVARSAPLERQTVGAEAVIDAVADCVLIACHDAGLTPENVALAIVKCPTLLASACVQELFRSDQHRGRALAALGVAVALNEISRTAITDHTIAKNLDIFSQRAMTFAGPEQGCIEVIVLGQDTSDATNSDGCRVGVCHPHDMLDAATIRRLMLSLGLTFDEAGELTEPKRVVAILSKSGPAPDGKVRGARTGVFTSAYSPDSNMRAAQSGLLGGLFGTTRFFVSGDPVQQAPQGGGVVALIVKESL